MGRHKEWRKIAKRVMRKRKRIQKAKERDEEIKLKEEERAQSPSYQLWVEEQERLELFREEEEERLRVERNKCWLEEEEAAQERWIKQQKKLERLKAEKAKQELIIREEWEKEQQKLKEEAEARVREKERNQREKAELLDRIEKYVAGESDRLPSSTRTCRETHPGYQECPFFAKVASCRFRDSCSRNHIRPNISRTLLLAGLYSNFRMEHNLSNEYDTDVGLEYDDKEIYQDFLEFYDDVLNELKTFGPVVQFVVCCNEEAHLRGNVYVQYSEERYAIKAFRALQGRYYGGKRILVEFCKIVSWSKALCGLFFRKKCPKGGKCNFLHAFRNPTREFYYADRDVFQKRSPKRHNREKVDWSWSPSPESVRHIKRKCDRNSSRSEHLSKRRNRESHASKEKSDWNWSPSPEPVYQDCQRRSRCKENRSERRSESRHCTSPPRKCLNSEMKKRNERESSRRSRNSEKIKKYRRQTPEKSEDST